MKYLIILFLLLNIFGCKQEKRASKLNYIETVKKEKSINEIISGLSKTDTIKHFDLSNKKLNTLPDLSIYKIESLDLSFNNLDTIPLSKLPSTLIKLNASNNNLIYFISNNYKNCPLNEVKKYDNSNLNLKDINLSNNKLKVIGVNFWPNKKEKTESNLVKLNASNNQLEHLHIDGEINYLNVSNNPNLPSEVNFTIKTIDTLFQKNNTNKLKTKVIPKPGPIICSLETIYSTFPKIKYEEK